MLNHAEAFTHWMKHQALPAFLEKGIHHAESEGTSFTETLPAVPSDIRSRVQSRQLYVFAHATRTGWIDGSSELERVLEKGLKPYHDSQGVFYFSNGSNEQAKRQNAYEQAFALLAYSELYNLTADPRFRKQAEQLHDWMQKYLCLAEGGYALHSGRPSLLSQNPHMHLFEAALAWWSATKDPRWEKEAHQIFSLFRRHFFDEKNGCLIEFFAPGWLATLSESRQLDPGHHYEWIWLLYEYQSIAGVDTSRWRNALLGFITPCGENTRTGAVMNEIWSDKTPCRTASRLWCQTERIKADVVNILTHPQESSCRQIETHTGNMLRLYIEPPTVGVYCDEITDTGEQIVAPAPASTLYHLYVASRQVERVLPVLAAQHYVEIAR